jgi:hypothetical protein
MNRPVSFIWSAALFALFVLWSAAHAQTALTVDEARAIVAPLYDALNQPSKKDVASLLGKAASPNWQSCGMNDQCVQREPVVAGIKSRGETIPDRKWEIKDLIVAGNNVIVRRRGAGHPGRSAL